MLLKINGGAMNFHSPLWQLSKAKSKSKHVVIKGIKPQGRMGSINFLI
jgi:hypothetical protein